VVREENGFKYGSAKSTGADASGRMPQAIVSNVSPRYRPNKYSLALCMLVGVSYVLMHLLAINPAKQRQPAHAHLDGGGPLTRDAAARIAMSLAALVAACTFHCIPPTRRSCTAFRRGFYGHPPVASPL